MSWRPNSARISVPSISGESDSPFRSSSSRNRSNGSSSTNSAINSLTRHVQLESDTGSDNTSMRSVRTERSRVPSRQESSSNLEGKGKGRAVEYDPDTKRQRRKGPVASPTKDSISNLENDLPASRPRNVTKKQSWFAAKESPNALSTVPILSTSASSATLRKPDSTTMETKSTETARSPIEINGPPPPSEFSPTITASDNSYKSWISTFSLSRAAVERQTTTLDHIATPAQIVKAEAQALDNSPLESSSNVMEKDPEATLKAQGGTSDDSTLTPRPNRLARPPINQRLSWWQWNGSEVTDNVIVEQEVESILEEVAEVEEESKIMEPPVEQPNPKTWYQSYNSFWSDHSQAPIFLPSNTSISSSNSTKSAASIECQELPPPVATVSTPTKGHYHTLKTKASALFPRTSSNSDPPKPPPIEELILPAPVAPVAPIETRGRGVTGARTLSMFGKSPGLGVGSSVSSRASSRSRNSAPNSPLLAPVTDAPLKPLTGSLRSSSSLHARQDVEEVKVEDYVLPTFEDTFLRGPRSFPLKKSGLTRTVGVVSAYLFSQPPPKDERVVGLECAAAERLPKSFEIMGDAKSGRNLPLIKNGIKVVTLGVGGWNPNPSLKVVFGEPTGTSSKFCEMMNLSVQRYLEDKNVPSFNIQNIVLQADGIVEDRVEKLYSQLVSRPDWVDALRAADQIFIATHSQGCIVSTHLLARVIEQGLCSGTRVMMLAMCGIIQGPFMYLSQSYTLSPYFNYLESASARELFEYQDPASQCAKKFLISLRTILAHGVKITAVGSINDQVVPLYSGLFSGIESPNILRAIYIDAAAFKTSDFLSNLVVFACRLRNCGLSDHDLIYHLSESLASALSGNGHSKLYDDEDVFNLAVRYQFETTQLFDPPTLLNSLGPPPALSMTFNPQERRNPYLLTWSLRGIVEDVQVRNLFSPELQVLREAFETWHPATKVLKEVKLKLEGIRMLPRVAIKKEGKL